MKRHYNYVNKTKGRYDPSTFCPNTSPLSLRSDSQHKLSPVFPQSTTDYLYHHPSRICQHTNRLIHHGENREQTVQQAAKENLRLGRPQAAIVLFRSWSRFTLQPFSGHPHKQISWLRWVKKSVPKHDRVNDSQLYRFREALDQKHSYETQTFSTWPFQRVSSALQGRQWDLGGWWWRRVQRFYQLGCRRWGSRASRTASAWRWVEW